MAALQAFNAKVYNLHCNDQCLPAWSSSYMFVNLSRNYRACKYTYFLALKVEEAYKPVLPFVDSKYNVFPQQKFLRLQG